MPQNWPISLLFQLPLSLALSNASRAASNASLLVFLMKMFTIAIRPLKQNIPRRKRKFSKKPNNLISRLLFLVLIVIRKKEYCKFLKTMKLFKMIQFFVATNKSLRGQERNSKNRKIRWKGVRWKIPTSKRKKRNLSRIKWKLSQCLTKKNSNEINQNFFWN